MDRPRLASGETCKTSVPKLLPLMRASLMRTISFTPRLSSLVGIGRCPHSGKTRGRLSGRRSSIQNRVFIHVEIFIVDVRSEFLVALEDQGAPAVLEQMRGGGRLLEHGAVGRQVAV